MEGFKMGITRPYRRTCRIFTDMSYSNSGKSLYIKHSKYALKPGNFIRAFQILQKDLIALFDYVEPSELNLNTHSYRIHELLLRTCVEVEANCTAILRENDYKLNKEEKWNMGDYKKIEQSHYLSHYNVLVPNWHGSNGIFKPFENWADGGSLPWFKTYNETKHDRHKNFSKANFQSLVNAFCGLSVIIAAQFHTTSFSPAGEVMGLSGGGLAEDFEPSIGDFLQIHFPTDIPLIEQYDFDYSDINFEVDIFENFDYS